MVFIVRNIKDIISTMPIDSNNPLPMAVAARDGDIKQIHNAFVSDLTNLGSTLYTRDELARRQHSSLLGAVSHK